MRIDDDDIYVLPTLRACYTKQRGEECKGKGKRSSNSETSTNNPDPSEESNDELDKESDFVFTENETASFLMLKLEQLPLLTDEGEQTPIGARGWYSSAVLSAMLLCGHETLHNDIFGNECDQSSEYKRQKMMIELGSGTVGLVGMTLAWVVAQGTKDQSTSGSTKIMLTDYDADVLRQLEKNVQETKRRLCSYFGDDAAARVPKIEAAHLDWNGYHHDQAMLKEGDGENGYEVSFVCGAALVYTEETSACADMVAKILRMYPQAAVWVVQWPRNGWFQVFQMQLHQKYQCNVQKFSPSKNIHPHIHELAQSFMPPQIELDVEHIKAVRITGPSKIEKKNIST